MLLVGHFTFSADEKGRVFLPARFREEMGPSFVLMPDEANGCIAGYSESYWNEIIIPNLKNGEESKRDEVRVLHSKIDLATVDKQGRIILPQTMREYLGVPEGKAEITILGCSTYIEFWSRERYEKMSAGISVIPKKVVR